jgi:hypothetical protein
MKLRHGNLRDGMESGTYRLGVPIALAAFRVRESLVLALGVAEQLGCGQGERLAVAAREAFVGANTKTGGRTREARLHSGQQHHPSVHRTGRA